MREALALRAQNITALILVFSYVPKETLKELAGKNIAVTVSNFDALNEAIEADVPFHIKIESGLGRQGFLESDMEKALEALIQNPNAKADGLYSHLAAAEHPKRKDYNLEQKSILEKWRSAVKGQRLMVKCHLAGSAAAMMWPDFHLDMVRIGISLYGLWPSDAVKNSLREEIDLRPALSWKSVVSEVKVLPKGHNTGYDLVETLSRDTKIAIVPVGYWHGYDRRLSGKGRVYVNGQMSNVLGRISMDMTVIDVTDCADVKRGDVVELLGPHVTADEIASAIGSINYEVVTRINPEIERIVR